MHMFCASRLILASQCLLLACSCAWGQGNLVGHIQQTEKSVVGIQTELSKTMPTNPPRMATFERTAAGLIIDPSGIIVTNTHTIIHAPLIFIFLRDGTKLRAHIIFSSKRYDFSFLKIKPPYPLRAIQWANSSIVKVGKPIVAIRNIDHNNQSILYGHIKKTFHGPFSRSNDFLELDLALRHGDSGGPILDEQGRLLGIIMAKRESRPNSSIAIASNKIHQQYLQYKKNMP